MKLYLSSYKIGNKAYELTKWLEENDNKIYLIANSRDVFPDGERKIRGIQSDIQELEELGFQVEILDLRKYFGKQGELRELFKKVRAFYVIGGNTFVLRKAMFLSGFDEILKEFSDNPNYLYAGYSAGVCLLSKRLEAVAIMDEPDLDPYESDLPPIYDGIGFFDEAIIPHYRSNHRETSLAEEAVIFCSNNNLPYIAMQDGDVIIRDLTNCKEQQVTK